MRHLTAGHVQPRHGMHSAIDPEGEPVGGHSLRSGEPKHVHARHDRHSARRTSLKHRCPCMAVREVALLRHFMMPGLPQSLYLVRLRMHCSDKPWHRTHGSSPGSSPASG